MADIEQSTHPMVTVAPHLSKAIGVQLVSSEETTGIFRPLLNTETALPARRSAQYSAPKDGGDVFVRICEGTREIKVTKVEPKPKAEDEDDEDDSDDDEEEEEEEIREISWSVSKPIAEFAIRDVKPRGKIEVMVSVSEQLAVQITAREIGGKGGVRGVVEPPQVVENGA